MAKFKRKGGKGKAKVDKRQNKRIKKLELMVNPEPKMLQQAEAEGACAVTLAMYSPFTIAQGLLGTNRIGNQINPVYLRFHWQFRNTATDVYHYARLFVFQDVAYNGGTVSDANTMYSTSAAGYTFGDFNYGSNVEPRKSSWLGQKLDHRIKVLYDTGNITLAPGQSAGAFNVVGGANGTVKQVKKIMKIRPGTQIQYIGTGSSLADIGNGHIWIATVADSTAVFEQGVYSTMYYDS